jgi:hypothetical protein
VLNLSGKEFGFGCFAQVIKKLAQINLYRTEGRTRIDKWWPLPDSNRGPTDYESGALTN